jgi:ribonuclease H2 subunit A
LPSLNRAFIRREASMNIVGRGLHENKVAKMDRTVEERPDIIEEAPVSTVFVPPSIHRDDLLSGDSYSHYTPIPSLIRPSITSNESNGDDLAGTECVLGVDEAGRGPVLGPMIYGAFYLPIELHHSLLASTYHFNDSKVLTPIVRANLTKAVCSEGSDLYKSCGWSIKSLSARDIGAGMLKNGGSYNLNAQAMDATIEIIRGVIDQGVNVREVYIDTIGNPAAYQKKLERVFPALEIRVEKKADSLFPCVSAASVVAKVTRDVSCELLYEEYARLGGQQALMKEGAVWGSGYPSDARCVNWLKSDLNPLFGFGNECRFSWGTIKDLMELKGSGGLKVDWPAEQDEENTLLSEYFMGGPSGGKADTESDQLRTWFGASVGQEAF